MHAAPEIAARSWQYLVALALVNLIMCDAQSTSCSSLQTVTATGSGEIVSHTGVGITNYTNNLICTWRITSPAGSRIVAWFTYIDLEVPFDTVQIIDGTSIASTFGNDIINLVSAAASASYVSPRMISLSNVMTLHFTTDATNTALGFRVRYDVISAINSKFCGSISYTSPPMSGSFGSSNGSQPSVSNMSCFWTLPKISGYTNHLTVSNFTLGDGDCVRLPTSAFLASRLNSNTEYCGPMALRTAIFIDSDEISNIVFFTSKAEGSSRFTIQFEYLPLLTGSLNAAIVSGTNVQSLTLQVVPYPNNNRDYWQLTAPVDTRLELWFTHLNFQYPNDAITLYSINGTQAMLLVHMDANASALYSSSTHYISSTNVVRTAFKTDSSGTALGFRMLYMVTEEFCGGLRSLNITTVGDIVSHNQVGNRSYLNIMNCRWHLAAPTGFAVLVQFLNFNLETCCDKVILYDGSLTERIIYNSQGVSAMDVTNLLSRKFQSTSNVMTVTFSADDSIVGNGFRLRYNIVKLDDPSVSTFSGGISTTASSARATSAVDKSDPPATKEGGSSLALALGIAIPAITLVGSIVGIVIKVLKVRRSNAPKAESNKSPPPYTGPNPPAPPDYSGPNPEPSAESTEDNPRESQLPPFGDLEFNDFTSKTDKTGWK